MRELMKIETFSENIAFDAAKDAGAELVGTTTRRNSQSSTEGTRSSTLTRPLAYRLALDNH